MYIAFIMSRIFFEDPFWLYFLFGATETILLFLWWRNPSSRRAWSLAIPLLLGVAVYVIEVTVVTDREKIQKAIRAISADVRNGHTTVLETYLADDFEGTFQATTHDRTAVLELAETHLQRHGITQLSITDIDVKVNDNRARTSVVTRIQTRTLGHRAPLVLRWEVTWEKISGRWRITRASDPLYRL
jgi:hypothetical protein